MLDTAKAPMNPAWVSVLRYSCRWAFQAQDEPTAARKVTNALHLWGAYQEGIWFARNYDDISETFYLRQCLERLEADGTVGQCNDFADLLLCLQTSLGVSDRVVQRTHPLNVSARVERLPNGHEGVLIDFTTHTIDVAPWGDSPPYDGSARWVYHQFVIETSTALVWDGCLQFHPSYRLAVTGMPRDTEYRDRLVRQYNFLDTKTGTQVEIADPAFFWVPTPQSGLIPSITSQ
ncbi:hypothetical protein HRbin16_01060 [bacterium HR16]|nr:hypothetical protein HRbin16_01060 [bacterium HR16]